MIQVYRRTIIIFSYGHEMVYDIAYESYHECSSVLIGFLKHAQINSMIRGSKFSFGSSFIDSHKC